MKLSACSILIGAVVADYPGYTIPNEPNHIEWAAKDHARDFKKFELGKDFVKYQMPDDEYVPIEDLPIVYLNGIKFHRQGKQPKHDLLDRFRKITRSKDGHLKCKGNNKAKMHQEEHASEMHHENPHEFIGIGERQLDLVRTIFQTKYPRYNGRDVPLPYNELVQADLDLTNLEPENSFEFEFTHGDVREEEEGEVFEEVNFPSEEFITPFIIDEDQEDPVSEADYEQIRLDNLKALFKSQSKVKIGCCNGLPYNSSKRCCCRRIPFDKERKFCCAINGCESFQIFDRSNKQHYKDCLSLSGLVIQEYGYRGQGNQPRMKTGTTKSRPT